MKKANMYKLSVLSEWIERTTVCISHFLFGQGNYILIRETSVR